MNHNENHPHAKGQGFQYNYSAKEQAELKRIREKYLADTQPQHPDKMTQIRRLDAGVTRKGTIVALILGIAGTLIMGIGMSLVMTDLSAIFGWRADMAFALGSIIGLVGMICVIMAYPCYQHLTAKERKKVAPEILRLTEELMNEGN